MRFSDFSIVLMAMIGSVYGQDDKQTATNLDDVRPGHIGDMTALPYEIQRCIKLNIPMAWTDYVDHLDLFCDKNTGTWHQDLPICIANAFPSSAADAISQYNTFISHLCSGYAGPGMPLTTILTIDDTLTVSTIFPTSSNSYYILPSQTPRYTTSTSHACIWGKDNCRKGEVYRTLYSTRSKSSKWRKTSEMKIPSSTPWHVSKRPTTPVAMPTK